MPNTRAPVIGREREVRALRDLLLRREVGLVTLTGTGGTGKTRLALQVAASLLDDFPDGVHVVPLTPISSPDLVTPAIASVLDIEEAGSQALEEAIHGYLRDRRVLLLLDNFEQVLDAAPVVADLLHAAPHLTVMVTSREPLHLTIEHEFPVPPLRLPGPADTADPDLLARAPAVALFLQRVRAIRPDFGLTRDNARTIADICIRLDGLPLALELAAARLKVVPPHALLDHLSHRLQLLTGGSRDLPPRQRTLRGTIDWSYDLLTPDEQRLFYRLAPFAGGFTLAAVEFVTGDGDAATPDRPTTVDVLNRVTSLVDKSLLGPSPVSTDEPRFTMLETIREYAFEQLEARGEAPAIRRRHACFFLKVIERAEPFFFGGDRTILIDRLETEHDNLRAALGAMLEDGETELALRLAGTLAWFWYDHGHLSEGRRWLDAALDCSGDAAAGLRAKALIGAGALAHRQSDLPSARQQLEAGLGISRTLRDDWNVALALINLGLVAHDQGDYMTALAMHQESLALCRASGNEWGIGTSLSNLAWSALFAGDLPRARAVGEEALAVRRAMHDQLGLAYTLYTLGRVTLEQGEQEQSRAFLAESIGLFQELGERWGLAACLETLAIANTNPSFGANGALQAARLWGAAESLRQTIGAPLTPADQQAHQRHQQDAQARANEQAWNDAWNSGRSLPLDELLDAAYQEPLGVAQEQSTDLPAGLTERELEVLRLVAEGLTNPQVADRLSLSPRTIGQHLRSIYTKLDVNSRTAAARFAIEHDLV